jgi:PAS domain S-box-containing protein
MSSSASLASQRRRFVVAVPFAALLTAAFAVLLQPSFTLGLRQSVSGLGFLLAGVLAALCCGHRAALTTGRRRRSWRMFMAAGCVAVAGNLWVLITGADPVESPSAISNVSIALALLLSIGGLLGFPSARRRGVDQLLMSLDGLVAGTAVLVIASVLVYNELLDSVTDDLASRSVALLFPVLDVVLATVALLLLLRTGGSDRPALALVTAGFVTYAVADLSFAVLAAQDRFHFGTSLDLGWIAGYLLIGLAALYPSGLADDAEDHTAGQGSDARGTIVVVAVLLAAGVVQVAFGTEGRLPVAQSGLWLVLILAAGVRQMLLAADNATLRRGLERRVREQTADLTRLARQTEVLLTSVGDGIYGVDHDGRITFINPSGAEALGYDAPALHGLRAHDLFHAPGEDGTPLPASGCYIDDAIRLGLVASGEEDVYVRADGATFPVEITASPLVDNEEVRGAVVAFRDVTQRREVDRMKSEFLSVVSHELRTPLTSIRGSLGLLAGGKLGELPPRAGALVDTALQSSERLTRLINDLLDIERIASDARPLHLEVIEADRLLANAAQAIEGLSGSARVRIEVGPCSGRVLADEDRIMQTLTNLLGNAIKYSDPGGLVVLDATQRGADVLFRVRDEGRGIPEDKLETVFERFEQVDSSDARLKGGTGLGLAISRGIVERHGGRIWAESRLGSGTTILFTLPGAPVPSTGADAPGHARA